MGHSGSKNAKINKSHDKQKMFRIGISVGRNNVTLEGHFQLGYHGKTIKNYTPVENHSPSIEVKEPVTEFVTEED